MLTTVQRIRLSGLIIAVIIVIIGTTANFFNGGKLHDVRVLGLTRDFSYAIEHYKTDYLRYPVGDTIDLRKQILLSENGFAPGSKIYFQGSIPSGRPVMYQSDGKTYRLSFTLRQRWPKEGLNSTACMIIDNAVLNCK